MNEDFFFKGKGLSAVPEVALSFNVGPGPVSIGLAYFNANPPVNYRSKASVKYVFLVLSTKSASALPGVEVTVGGP